MRFPLCHFICIWLQFANQSTKLLSCKPRETRSMSASGKLQRISTTQLIEDYNPPSPETDRITFYPPDSRAASRQETILRACATITNTSSTFLSEVVLPVGRQLYEYVEDSVATKQVNRWLSESFTTDRDFLWMMVNDYISGKNPTPHQATCHECLRETSQKLQKSNGMWKMPAAVEKASEAYQEFSKAYRTCSLCTRTLCHQHCNFRRNLSEEDLNDLEISSSSTVDTEISYLCKSCHSKAKAQSLGKVRDLTNDFVSLRSAKNNQTEQRQDFLARELLKISDAARVKQEDKQRRQEETSYSVWSVTEAVKKVASPIATGIATIPSVTNGGNCTVCSNELKFWNKQVRCRLCKNVCCSDCETTLPLCRSAFLPQAEIDVKGNTTVCKPCHGLLTLRGKKSVFQRQMRAEPNPDSPKGIIRKNAGEIIRDFVCISQIRTQMEQQLYKWSEIQNSLEMTTTVMQQFHVLVKHPPNHNDGTSSSDDDEPHSLSLSSYERDHIRRPQMPRSRSVSCGRGPTSMMDMDDEQLELDVESFAQPLRERCDALLSEIRTSYREYCTAMSNLMSAMPRETMRDRDLLKKIDEARQQSPVHRFLLSRGELDSVNRLLVPFIETSRFKRPSSFFLLLFSSSSRLDRYSFYLYWSDFLDESETIFRTRVYAFSPQMSSSPRSTAAVPGTHTRNSSIPTWTSEFQFHKEIRKYSDSLLPDSLFLMMHPACQRDASRETGEACQGGHQDNMTTTALPPNFTPENIKLVVTDVDGTLLGPDHRLSEKTAAVLNALPEHVHFMLATGKTKWSTQDIFDRVERLQNNPSIFLNGMLMTKPDGTHIYQSTLAPEVVTKMIEFSQATNRFLTLHWGDRIVASASQWKQHMADLLPMYHEPVCESIEHEELLKMVQDRTVEINKMMFLTETDSDAQAARSELSALFGEDSEISGVYDTVQAVPQMMEIIPKGSSKAVPLKKVCEQLNIKPENVIAFGDGENDITMLKYAGCSVAVGNARPFVKPVADFVSKTNGEDGMANVLAQVFDITV
ncbi:hypothetical protein PROFUN_01639 [Planoprotostelium fungivorum]|uniref:Uncharacterized protein n=1 Tax=Planoprotostelium fungivorum TaxID=1890364 RepID=A0A2P6NTS3_9EUKA|nr:hypothetical protein PROFUN_01639 [Planoprotostelium fungivorum]